jgi:hypothetical protein
MVTGQTAEIPPDVTVVSGTMSAGHYTRPADDGPVHHTIRFRARAAFTGPSPAQKAFVVMDCLGPCHQTREIGESFSLADFLRVYAQHAGRADMVLQVTGALKAIGDDGQDI